MYCHKCEREYDSNVRFCDICGLLLIAQLHPDKLVSLQQPNAEEPKGLRGWLIVLGIVLVFGLVCRSFLILRNVKLFTNGTVRLVSNPHSAGYIHGYTGMMEFEIVAYIAFLAFNILLAILFVKESRAFPRCFVAFIALSFIFVGVDHLIFSHAISGSSL